MTLVKAFLTDIKEKNPEVFKRFDTRLSADKNDKSKTITLKVHVFGGAKYTLAEIEELQPLWNAFVPAAYIGFTAPPLLVEGTAHYSPVTESEWTH